MDDLRRALQESGFTNCSVDLRHGSAGDPGTRQQSAARPDRGAAGGPTGDPVPHVSTPVLPTVGDRRLDLHI
jgi:hypothetical protein